MSLSTGTATSDRIDHGAGFLLPETFTTLMWTYPTADTGPHCLWWQSTPGVRHNFERKFGDTDDYSVLVDYATTLASCDTTGVDRPLNAWKFLAVTNLSVADGGPRVYHGNLTTPAVQASYSARAAGSGAFVAGTGSFIVGNVAGLNEAFIGRFRNLMVFNRVLTLAEIILMQFDPQLSPGLKIYSEYGFNGPGQQADLSGNRNSGTQTGCFVSQHPYANPYRPQPRQKWQGYDGFGPFTQKRLGADLPRYGIFYIKA